MAQSTLTDDAAHAERLIREANEAVIAANALLEVRVIAAREHGHSWQLIGRALSMTRQSAQQRFSRLPELSAHPGDAAGVQ
jgi:hypothetical protein